MTTAQLIPMTLWLPDFGNKEDVEITLQSEGIDYEFVSDNIIVCQADADLYEFLMTNCRKVLVVPQDKPGVSTPIRENEVEVEIPDCIPDDANAAAAASEAIEADLKAKTENPDFEDEDETKASLCENMYRVLHNRKIMSVQLNGITLKNGTSTFVINSVSRVKGKPNEIVFNCTCTEGRSKGQTQDVSKKNICKIEQCDIKFLRSILKAINHSF